MLQPSHNDVSSPLLAGMNVVSLLVSESLRCELQLRVAASSDERHKGKLLKMSQHSALRCTCSACSALISRGSVEGSMC